MDLRTLRAFVEVVRQGGFSAATDALCVSQSTVSKTIRQLEDEIGEPLLDRADRKLRPTAAGELVFRHAIAMLAERERLKGSLAELRGLKGGRLRLGLSRLGSSFLFGHLVAEFHRRHPEIELELVEHGALQLSQILLEGDLDLAMCLLPLPEELDWQLVHDEPLMALLPGGHPMVGRDSVRLADLADSPFILFEGGFALNPQIRAACQRQGFTPRVVAYSGQADFIEALVAAGLGVAFLPRLIVDGGVPAPISCALLEDDTLRWRITLAWRRDAVMSAAARAYLDLAREELAHRPAR